MFLFPLCLIKVNRWFADARWSSRGIVGDGGVGSQLFSWSQLFRGCLGRVRLLLFLLCLFAGQCNNVVLVYAASMASQLDPIWVKKVVFLCTEVGTKSPGHQDFYAKNAPLGHRKPTILGVNAPYKAPKILGPLRAKAILALSRTFGANLRSLDLYDYEECRVTITSANAKISRKFCNCRGSV